MKERKEKPGPVLDISEWNQNQTKDENDNLRWTKASYELNPIEKVFQGKSS